MFGFGRFQYTGQTWLPEIGMYYYKARIYAPKLARFLQTDPIGYKDGPNLYAYVGNNPLNLIDPTGACGSHIDGHGASNCKSYAGGNGRGNQNNREDTVSTVGGTGIGDFFDAYFDRVGGMLYGMADSFKITGEAGPQIKASFTALSFKPELTIGNFSSHLSLSGALNPEIGVKSPSFGNLYYGEASLSVGKFKVGAGLDSVTEGISLRDGPFQRVEQGFFGRTTVTGWKSDFGKVGGHVQVFFGVKFEWDWYQFFKSVDDAFDP